MSKTNKVNRIEEYRAMIAGVGTNVPATATIAIEGVVTAQPVIVSTLQGYVDAAAATATAKAAYADAVVKENTAAATARATYLGVKDYALATYAKAPATLGTFGLHVTVRKVPTPAVKAAADAKRKATIATKKAAEAAAAARTAAAAGAAPTPATGGSTATTTSKS
jgi:hypothetical protein